MLEKVINELLTIRGIDTKYWSTEDKQELASFLRATNADKKHLSSIRRWSKRLNIPASLIVRASKYDKLEEIWTD